MPVFGLRLVDYGNVEDSNSYRDTEFSKHDEFSSHNEFINYDEFNDHSEGGQEGSQRKNYWTGSFVPLKPHKVPFDIFNPRIVYRDPLSPSLPSANNNTTNATNTTSTTSNNTLNASSSNRIAVDSLESATVLALRLKHLKEGKVSAEEVRTLASEIFKGMTVADQNEELLELIGGLKQSQGGAKTQTEMMAGQTEGDTQNKTETQAQADPLGRIPTEDIPTEDDSSQDHTQSQHISPQYTLLLDQLLSTRVQGAAAKLGSTRIKSILSRNGYEMSDLERWVQCVQAPTFFYAVRAMESDTVGLDNKAELEGCEKEEERRWPTFLLLYTFRRACHSKLEVLEMMRLFDRHFAEVGNNGNAQGSSNQTKIVLRMVSNAVRYLPEILPDVCNVVVRNMKLGNRVKSMNEGFWNQLLWRMTMFGHTSTPSFFLDDDPTPIQIEPGVDDNSTSSPTLELSTQDLQNKAHRELSLIFQAQSILVQFMLDNDIPLDTKGYLSLAHSLIKLSPERARHLLNIVKAHNYPVSFTEQAVLDGRVFDKKQRYSKEKQRMHSTGMFPYIQASTCLDMMLCTDPSSVLNALDEGISRFENMKPAPRVVSEMGYKFTTSSMLWSTMIKMLKVTGGLDSSVTKEVWQRALDNGVQVSPYLLNQVLSGLSQPSKEGSDNDNASNIKSDSTSSSTRTDPREIDYTSIMTFIKKYVFSYNGSTPLAAKFSKLVCAAPAQTFRQAIPTHTSGLALTREVLKYGQVENPRIMYNALMASEVGLMKEKRKTESKVMANTTSSNLLAANAASLNAASTTANGVWSAYKYLLKTGCEPDIFSLYYLLRSASLDKFLVWDGHPASHRCIAEFRRWVRGAHLDGSDTNDLLKIYPSTKLFFAYVNMCAKTGNAEEVSGVLSWVKRVGLVPDRSLLCAILAYAPDSKGLMNHNENMDIKWPTQSQVEWFKTINKF